MSDREFTARSGVVIPLKDVLGGGQVSVLLHLERERDAAQRDAQEAKSARDIRARHLEDAELEYARADAKYQAYATAYEAARKVFNE